MLKIKIKCVYSILSALHQVAKDPQRVKIQKIRK